MVVKVTPKRSRSVIKRSGERVPWDQERIVRALCLAFYDVRTQGTENPEKEDPEAFYGLKAIGHAQDYEKATELATKATRMLTKEFNAGKTPTIEQIQDVVERVLYAEEEYDVARSYILYRAKQAERRFKSYSDNGMSEYVRMTKYARYIPEQLRRETLPESVNRVKTMHEDFLLQRYQEGKCGKDFSYTEFLESLENACVSIEELRTWPSSRNMQFGGQAVLSVHERSYNCSFTPIDRLRAFAEVVYLLLAGSGVGFSVQKQHIAKLPQFPNRGNEFDLKVRHFVVPDTIQGWAEAVEVLFDSYLNNYKVEFSYHLIRDRGTALKTSGGKAPGHLGLKKALMQVEAILQKCSGRRLKSIEAYDCLMYLAEAVLSGGIRRSATICLFSVDDEEMATAKTGNWLQDNAQRQYSNNTVVLLRNQTDRQSYSQKFKSTKEYGEPGFYWTENVDFGLNPCAEAAFYPYLHVDSQDVIDELKKRGYQSEVKLGDRLSGYQMCNLTTINGSRCKTPEEFYQECKHASFMGTVQAAYTKFPFLGPVTELIVERDALLGVSITGFMDNPELLFNPDVLRRGAEIVKETNAYWAKKFGINPATRSTVVKPEGTASKVLGSASGIHLHHSKRYFRLIKASKIEAPYVMFKSVNAHMTERSVFKPETDDYVVFPVEAPKDAPVRGDLSAIEFLDKVKLVYQNWILPGTREAKDYHGLTHNVSNTVDVRPEEWADVEQYLWDNKDFFAALSFLPFDGEAKYIQAPNQTCTDSKQDIDRWNSLEYIPVNYTMLREDEDGTSLQDNMACVSGYCEII